MTCFTRIHPRHQSSLFWLLKIYFNCLYFATGTFFLAHSDLISLKKDVFDRSQVNVLYTDTFFDFRHQCIP